MDPLTTIFGIAILIFSVVIHEVAHGYAADSLGDPTARFAGRLTLNPLRHLDLVGSFIVPVLTAVAGGFIFGWAKPVPYNPYNISKKHGDAMVAIAGPVSNIVLAILAGLVMRFVMLPSGAVDILSFVVLINIILALFNLIPIPPLDGSKILFSFLPAHLSHFQEILERSGFFIVIIFVFFFWQLLVPVIFWLFRLITGTGF
ncbi:MAG: site-2 protease family protein [Candidatus Paceibacterota bacterium]